MKKGRKQEKGTEKEKERKLVFLSRRDYVDRGGVLKGEKCVYFSRKKITSFQWYV